MDTNKFFTPEKNVTVSTVLPLSLKNKMLMEASRLGISLSEFLYHLIENSGCNAFSSNELVKKEQEIEDLKKQISELKNAQDGNTPKPEEEEPEEETDDERNEELQGFADRLNTAYCNLKKFSFKTFSELQIYKEAYRLMQEQLQEEVAPELQEMKAKGLQNIVYFFVSKMKNPEKIDKQKLLAEIEAEFEKTCQMDKILNFGALSPKEKKNYYNFIQNEILGDFSKKIEEIEENVFFTEDFELFVSCPLETQEIEELQETFEEDLNQDVRLYEYFQSTFEEEQKELFKPQAQEEPKPEYTPKSKEERILHELHQKGEDFITAYELKKMGFDVGFWSKLTVRGATYGAYKLEKAPSEKVYKISKLNDSKNNK